MVAGEVCENDASAFRRGERMPPAMSFAPVPLTRNQKRIVLALAIVIALTRLLAVAHSLFDWDEALFSLGVREYDVSLHHPHPPGYPLFIAAAKVVHLAGVPEFRSLQAIVLLGGFFVFPALFFLAQEIGFRFATAVSGAAIFAFLPNVWIYGGTGFSDVPSATLIFAACALLLRGRRSPRSLVLGGVMLGIATGFRTPSVLMGAVPALLATVAQLRARRFGHVAAAIVLGGAIAGGSYAGAALASQSVEAYRNIMRTQSEYVRSVDSWQNPDRPPLHEVAKVFFLWPMRERTHAVRLLVLALLGVAGILVRRRFNLLLPFAIFGPFALLAWFTLDFQTASRYAIGYMGAYALFAAAGLETLGRRPFFQAVLTVAVIAMYAVWAWPALRTQRTSDSPPVAALEWVRRNVPRDARVQVHSGIAPQADFLIPEWSPGFFDTVAGVPVAGDVWVVDLQPEPSGHNFAIPRNSLWDVVRSRNFEASVARVTSLIQFGKGWYEPESAGPAYFRWMGRESEALLPPLPGSGRLEARIFVPVDTITPPPEFAVYVNGELVDRIGGTSAEVDRVWIVPSRHDAPNELRVVTSAVIQPAGDPRELGLRFDALEWTPQH